MALMSPGEELPSAWFAKKNGARYKYVLRDLTQLEYFGVPGSAEKTLWNNWFFPAEAAAAEVASESVTVSITETAVVAAFTPVTASDSLTVRLNGTETSSLIGKTATDSLAVIASEAVLNAASVVASESLRVVTDDVFTGSRSATASDSLTVSFTEIATTTATLAIADTLTVGLTDAVSLFASVLTASDALAVQFSDLVRPVVSTTTTSDALAAGLADTFTGSQAFLITDTLSAGLTEASLIASFVVASDSLTVALSETVQQMAAVLTASESMTVTVSDAVQPVAVAAFASESLRVALTDTFTGSQAFSLTDSLTISLTEASTLSVLTFASDSLAVQLSEVVSQISAVLSTTETLTVQTIDVVQPVFVVAVASDSLRVALSDVFTGSQAFTLSESLTVTVAEVASLSVTTVASDSLAVLASESAALTGITLYATDALAVVLTDAGVILQTSLLAASDTVAVVFGAESSQIINAVSASEIVSLGLTDLFTGAQALVVSDAPGVLLSEDQHSSLLMSASDTTGVVLSGALSVQAAWTLADSLAVAFLDLGTKQDLELAIAKFAADTVRVQVETSAATATIGPYWNGWTGEEHGLVHRDSYVMGRRENYRKAVW